MFDPSKASNEEWQYIEPTNRNSQDKYEREGRIEGPRYLPIPDTLCFEPTDAEEIVLLHNEQLIIERRKPLRWFVFPWNDGWVVCHGNGHKLTRDDGTYFTGPYPIGLLSEADAYFRERGK